MTPAVKHHTFKDGAMSFITQSKKHFIVMARYPINFVASFGVIILFMMMFVLAAMMFTDPNDPDSASDFTGIIAYGFILFMFLTSTLWDIGYTIRDEQMQGTLESYYLTPVNRFSNMISRIFASFIWTALNTVAAIIMIYYVVGDVPAENVLLGIYLLAMSIVGFMGLGFMFSAITLKLKESAALLANFLQFFFMIFCAMFFPFSALPDVIKNYVSRLIPISYCVDSFRSVMSGTDTELMSLSSEIVIVTLFGILAPIAGYFMYKYIENLSRVDGSLSEY